MAAAAAHAPEGRDGHVLLLQIHLGLRRHVERGLEVEKYKKMNPNRVLHTDARAGVDGAEGALVEAPLRVAVAGSVLAFATARVL